MRLALVLAITNYKDESARLPACNADAALITTIVRLTEKYDTVKVINDEGDSTKVKSELRDFNTSHKDKKVEEVFFYFTGHGEVYKGDFRYLLADYEEGKRNQTSLSNSDLDTMLRALNPAMAIKVIDAC